MDEFWLCKEGEGEPKCFNLHNGRLYVPTVLKAFKLEDLEIRTADHYVYVDVQPDDYSLAVYAPNTRDKALAVKGRGVAGPGPGSQAELFTAAAAKGCEQALQRMKAAEEVSVSSVGSTEWQQIAQASQLSVMGVQLPDPDTSNSQSSNSSSSSIFEWDPPMSEGSHSARYFQHLKELFPVSGRSLSWLEGGNKEKDLLSLADSSGRLHYGKINGNTDVAIVTRSSYKLPQCGLCILFELKKEVDKRAMYQAMCQLLLANHHCAYLQPVVVLTNLQDSWTLFWLDERTIKFANMARPAAIATVKALVKEAEARASPAMDASGAASSQSASLPAEIGGRKPFPLGGGGGGAAMDASLGDLEGMLPSEELEAAHAVVLLQQLRNVPAFSCMADSDFPAHMYS